MFSGPAYRFLWRHARPYWPAYLAMLIAPLSFSLYTFLCHYAIKLFLEKLTQEPGLSFYAFGPFFIVVLGALLFIDLSWYLHNWLSSSITPATERAMLLESYHHLQHHSYTFFQAHTTGELMSKLKETIKGYAHFLEMVYDNLLLHLCTIGVNFIALASMSAYLALFLAAWGVLFLTTMYTCATYLEGLKSQEDQAHDQLLGKVSDHLLNITSVILFHQHDQALQKLQREAKERLLPLQQRCWRYRLRLRWIGLAFYLVFFTGVLGFAFLLAQHGYIRASDIVFILLLAYAFGEGLWLLTSSFRQVSTAMGAWDNALSFYTLPHAEQDPPGAPALVIQRARISFQGLSYAHPGQPALFEAFDLEIAAGERIGLVGRSGAGKSSLLHLLLRLYPCGAGQIKIDGQAIDQVSARSLREQIAFIPQEALLFKDTLLENIRYGALNATQEEVIQACQHAHLHEAIMALPEGYQTCVGERGTKLSGGQRQRVAIARALLKSQARILLLDEATSALDTPTEQAIQEQLEHLYASRKQTVIVIAHRLATLQKMDRLLVLEKGRLIEQGTHQSLLARPGSYYQALWAGTTPCTHQG